MWPSATWTSTVKLTNCVGGSKRPHFSRAALLFNEPRFFELASAAALLQCGPALQRVALLRVGLSGRASLRCTSLGRTPFTQGSMNTWPLELRSGRASNVADSATWTSTVKLTDGVGGSKRPHFSRAALLFNELRFFESASVAALLQCGPALQWTALLQVGPDGPDLSKSTPAAPPSLSRPRRPRHLQVSPSGPDLFQVGPVGPDLSKSAPMAPISPSHP